MQGRLALLSLLLIAFSVTGICQQSKPIIDTAALNKWPGLDDQLNISNDGKYFSYGTTRGGFFYSIVVQSTENDWQQEFIGAKLGFFTADSRQYVLETPAGLCILLLGKEEAKYIKAA